MKTFEKINLVLISLLSLTAGIPKIIQLPEESEFFQSVGISVTLMIIFGVIQSAGGILLVVRKTRLWGAITMALTFAISTIMIFVGGKTMFGLLSIIPIVMIILVIRTNMTSSLNKPG